MREDDPAVHLLINGGREDTTCTREDLISAVYVEEL